MRLIDADALLNRMQEDPLFDLVERYGVSGVINAEPTVDAIPIEWIKEYIELQESYDTEIGDIFGVGVREMLRYCAERKDNETD